MSWLSNGEEIVTLAFFVLIQYRSVTVTDGQTDIPALAIPAVSTVRYANALVKTIFCQMQRKSLYAFRLYDTLD